MGSRRRSNLFINSQIGGGGGGGGGGGYTLKYIYLIMGKDE